MSVFVNASFHAFWMWSMESRVVSVGRDIMNIALDSVSCAMSGHTNRVTAQTFAINAKEESSTIKKPGHLASTATQILFLPKEASAQQTACVILAIMAQTVDPVLHALLESTRTLLAQGYVLLVVLANF